MPEDLADRIQALVFTSPPDYTRTTFITVGTANRHQEVRRLVGWLLRTGLVRSAAAASGEGTANEIHLPPLGPDPQPADIPAAPAKPAAVAVAVGFTHRGLRDLGVRYRPLPLNRTRWASWIRADDDPAARLPAEADPFQDGMAKRTELLHDHPPTDDLPADHGMLVWVGAKKEADLNTAVASIEAACGSFGLPCEADPHIGCWDKTIIQFQDGKGQPYITELERSSRLDRQLLLYGGGTATGDAWEPVPLGEMVLGAGDGGGTAEAPGPRWLTVDGTFLVYRRYRMAPTASLTNGLKKNMSTWSTSYGDKCGAADLLTEELWAKVVGRYRHKARPDPEGPDSVVAAVYPGTGYEPPPPDQPPGGSDPGPDRAARDAAEEAAKAQQKLEDRARDNRFDYADDSSGALCPLGAHVRRSNPRDSLGFRGDLVRRHRIIRRGAPFVYSAPKDATAENNFNSSVGLHFVAVNARIADQFEFIQRQWLNTGQTFRLGTDADWFVGAESPARSTGSARFVVQGERLVVLEQERLATLERGDYFLVPGLAGLRRLALP